MTHGRLTQVLASVNPADAVSDFAREIARRAIDRGHESRMLAAGIHPACRSEAQPLESIPPGPSTSEDEDLVLIHHSIGTGMAERAIGLPGRKVVVLVTDGEETCEPVAGGCAHADRAKANGDQQQQS